MYQTPTDPPGRTPDPFTSPAFSGSLVDAEERWRELVEQIPAVTYLAGWDSDSTLLYVSPQIEGLLGWPPEDFLADQDLWYRCIHPDDRDRVTAEEKRVFAAGEGFECEFRMVARDGRELWVWERDTILRDADGAPVGSQGVLIDITDRRAAEQQIAYLAYHDSLTGLPNRALLSEHLELALARATRRNQAVALLYFDLDDFKFVNDSLGHSAGDDLLCHIALRLGDRRRSMDLLARQGGDEFLLLLADLDRDGAEAVARHVAGELLTSLARPFTIAGSEFHIGASVGISVFPRDAGDGEELLRHADAAMYQAKSAGRNGIAVFDRDADVPLERLAMTSRVRKALAADEFVLYWQPIVDPRDGSLHGLEALLRWEDPDLGLIHPSEFVPFCEETGLIDRLGDWVADAACAQVEAWQRDGITAPPISINVSPRQLRRPDFAERLARRLGERVPDAQFTIEITETGAMGDETRTEQPLRALAAAGVRIAVDDFGAGYSSLVRLRELPVDVLKIDGRLLSGVPHDPQAVAIVTAIIELAAALGMTAVGEGVESEEQREFLIARGCPLAQGHLFSPPRPAAEIAPVLRAAQHRA